VLVRYTDSPSAGLSCCPSLNFQIVFTLPEQQIVKQPLVLQGWSGEFVRGFGAASHELTLTATTRHLRAAPWRKAKHFLGPNRTKCRLSRVPKSDGDGAKREGHNCQGKVEVKKCPRSNEREAHRSHSQQIP
jgi:hypothetical protein